MSAAASLRFAAELSPDAVRSWPDSAPATASTAATHASSPRSTPMLAHSSSAVAGLSLDANDRDAAGLMGINTSLVITFSYALSSMTAAFAGVLVAPVTLTGASMGGALGLKAFAVAIIGGLSSGMGVVVGGLILGITETLTGYYLSTGYKDVPGLVLLLLVLSLKPSGLFGSATIKKV